MTGLVAHGGCGSSRSSSTVQEFVRISHWLGFKLVRFNSKKKKVSSIRMLPLDYLLSQVKLVDCIS